jgi:predicted Fe-Mo cluster-binding NifX family protein
MEKGWKEIYITAHEYKAEMAKEILENEGIKVVVLNQQDTAYKTFGEYCLYVSEADEERAVELLKDLKH